MTSYEEPLSDADYENSDSKSVKAGETNQSQKMKHRNLNHDTTVVLFHVTVHIVCMFICLQSLSNQSFYRQITGYRMSLGDDDDERGLWANKSALIIGVYSTRVSSGGGGGGGEASPPKFGTVVQKSI